MRRRATKHDYDAPGSFTRLQEAAIGVADADPEDDVAYHGACCRLRAAALAYAAARPAPKVPRDPSPAPDPLEVEIASGA